MDAKRLQLLGAFAAGCLATLAFVGSWWTDAQTKPNQVVGVRAVMPVQAVAADSNEGAEGSVSLDATAKLTNAANEREDVAQAESGSSVAEVLGRLEAAYREELGRAQTVREEVAAEEPAGNVSETSAAAVIPPVAPLAPAAAVAQVTPVVTAPAAAADVTTVAPAPAPVLVAQTEAPARAVSTGDIHVGDSHRNVSVGSVHQGDAYALQQLALIQYIQFVTLSQHGAVAAPAQNTRKLGSRRVPPFSMSLTNPDNPWGFDFPPTVLVK